MTEQVMVSIPKALYQRVKQLAGRQNRDVNDVLAKTLAAALPSEEENEIVWAEPDDAVEREMRAYIAMHPLLKQRYLSRHVAIYHGQLIDQDEDMDALYARIDRQYPDEFVWITTVGETAMRTLEFRSPRFVREQ
ncbi:MAG: hypothetical protein ACE5EY_18000 [Anaerolineae bacterium]